jgi:hypothetical protein
MFLFCTKDAFLMLPLDSFFRIHLNKPWSRFTRLLQIATVKFAKIVFDWKTFPFSYTFIFHFLRKMNNIIYLIYASFLCLLDKENGKGFNELVTFGKWNSK